jgi:hypothetical protein
LAVAVPLVLNLSKEVVCNLQLAVPVQRQKCTTVENGILMPQPLGMLPIRGQLQTLLDDGLDGVVV